jgi:hypothetical protein
MSWELSYKEKGTKKTGTSPKHKTKGQQKQREIQ